VPVTTHASLACNHSPNAQSGIGIHFESVDGSHLIRLPSMFEPNVNGPPLCRLLQARQRGGPQIMD